MTHYHLEGSHDSPEIYIDRNNGILEITGVSVLTNTNIFYANITRWILAFNIGEKKTNTVNIKLTKLNQPTIYWIKFIINTLRKFLGRSQLVVNMYVKNKNQMIRDLIIECNRGYNVPVNLFAA